MTQAAYTISFYRDIRLGTVFFKPGEVVSHDVLVAYCGGERGINRLRRMGALTLVPDIEGLELSEGHEVSPSSDSVVLEPPTHETDGGENTEEHGDGEASNGDAPESATDDVEGTEASPGTEDPNSSGAEAEVELNEDVFDPEMHTVEEVKAFVGEHPELRDAVLAVEQDGRRRKSLIDWLAAGS
jgi:hypothetical protein